MTDNTALVTMSNALTRSAYTLSLSEKRLLMLAVTKLNGHSDDVQLLEIMANEYADFYSLNQKGAYRTLKNATDNLWARTLVTDDGTKYRWIITSKYESGLIELEFHPRIKPHLVQLKDKFTQYFLERAADFKLMYTWRLFELVMQFKTTGYLNIGIDDFKKILDVPKTYSKDFGKIREKVIKPAINEIKEKDGLEIKYTVNKTGRKVTGLEFKFPVEQQKKIPLKQPKQSTGKPKIDKAYIEQHARPGETYETARVRLESESRKGKAA